MLTCRSQGSGSGVISQIPPTSCLRQDLALAWSSPSTLSWPASGPQGLAGLCLSQNYNPVPPDSAFHTASGNWTQVFVFVQQVLYPLSYLSRHVCECVHVCLHIGVCMCKHVWGRNKEARADVRCQSLSETLNVELTDWTRLAAEQAPGSLPSPFLSSDIAAPDFFMWVLGPELGPSSLWSRHFSKTELSLQLIQVSMLNTDRSIKIYFILTIGTFCQMKLYTQRKII